MWKWIPILFLWLSATDIHARATDNLENTEFYLLTVGLGDRTDARFGHTILRVDQPDHEVHNYNWGTFSFNEPYFVLRFFLGKLLYWVEPWSDELVDWKYHEENRYVIRDRLQLTRGQKASLLALIDVNLQEQNKYFLYDFFLKNCSTIPRDHLNSILHNQIFDRFSKIKTSMRYRDYVRKYLNTPFFEDAFLEIAMNGTIDFQLSQWEEMFSPLKLREYLLQMPAFDDEGHAIAGKTLLVDTQKWIEAPDRPLVYIDLYWIVFLCLAFFLLYMGWQIGQGCISSVAAASAKAVPLSIRLLGGFLLPWSLLSGVLGSVMALAWLFSDHVVLQHNANLWFFWPIDLWLLWPTWVWCRGRVLPPRSARRMVALLGCHCAFALLAGGLWLGGWIHQDIGKIFLFLMIPMIGIYAIALHYARNQPFLAEKR